MLLICAMCNHGEGALRCFKQVLWCKRIYIDMEMPVHHVYGMMCMIFSVVMCMIFC